MLVKVDQKLWPKLAACIVLLPREAMILLRS